MGWSGDASNNGYNIDMLGYATNDVETLLNLMKKVCQTDVEDDGLVFDLDTATANVIQKDGDYQGVRVVLPWTLAGAKMQVQVDFGFGDSVYPAPEEQELPRLLDQSPTRLACYPRETLISEKFEAMVYLGERNSRVKDFYDVWLLSRNCEFRGETLVEAVSRTFQTRSTELDDDLIFLSDAFSVAKAAEWRAFLRKMRREDMPGTFEEVIKDLRPFFEPLAAALRHGESLGQWRDGAWKQ